MGAVRVSSALGSGRGVILRVWLSNTVRAVSLSLLGAAACLALASPASADADGYIYALDQAGLIDEGDRDPCNMVNGVCHGQFPNASAALQTGRWVCQQIAQGQSSSSIIYSLSHGEGLMPSSYNAPIIYNAATTYLC